MSGMFVVACREKCKGMDQGRSKEIAGCRDEVCTERIRKQKIRDAIRNQFSTSVLYFRLPSALTRRKKIYGAESA
jgi:hypothetical protein